MAIDPYWTQSLELWGRVSLYCRNGHYYRQVNNLGQFKCFQHAAPYDRRKRKWPCCGKDSPSDPGCVPADHNTHDFFYTREHDVLDMPLSLLKMFENGPGVEGSVIHRFDETKHNEMNPFETNGYTNKIKRQKTDVGEIYQSLLRQITQNTSKAYDLIDDYIESQLEKEKQKQNMFQRFLGIQAKLSDFSTRVIDEARLKVLTIATSVRADIKKAFDNEDMLFILKKREFQQGIKDIEDMLVDIKKILDKEEN